MKRDVLTQTTAALAAAISILERTPSARLAVGSDRMFKQMLADYRRALKAARVELRKPEELVPRKIKLSAAARTLIENHGLERYFADLL